MRTRAHRTIGAAFLSLLIAVSFLATSNWFCPDGQPCLPGLSPVCCCGCGPANAAIGPPPIRVTHRPGGLACLGKRGCRCYQDLSATAPMHSTTRVVVAAPVILPAPGIVIPEPPSGRGLLRSAAAPAPPPRFCIAPGDTRAPPAA